MNAQLITIKTKKLGVKIASLRIKSGYSIESLSQWAGISAEDFQRIEKGDIAPTLPQLEAIAGKLGVPYEELINGIISEDSSAVPGKEFQKYYLTLRNRIIGMNLKKARLENNLYLEKIAFESGFSVIELQQFESGLTAIPHPIIEILCENYLINPSSLLAEKSPYSLEPEHKKEEIVSQRGHQLPDNLSEFVENPANTPYLELARRLSELDAAKLRSIAEGLLEITY